MPADLLDGHRVVSYFSSRTGRPFPLRYMRGEETFEINGHTTVSVNESTAHLTTLLTGLGMAQTFVFMAKPYLDSGALVEVLTGWEPPPHKVYVVYSPNRHLSAKLRAFVDWVVEVFTPYSTA